MNKNGKYNPRNPSFTDAFKARRDNRIHRLANRRKGN